MYRREKGGSVFHLREYVRLSCARGRKIARFALTSIVQEDWLNPRYAMGFRFDFCIQTQVERRPKAVRKRTFVGKLSSLSASQTLLCKNWLRPVFHGQRVGLLRACKHPSQNGEVEAEDGKSSKRPSLCFVKEPLAVCKQSRDHGDAKFVVVPWNQKAVGVKGNL